MAFLYNRLVMLQPVSSGSSPTTLFTNAAATSSYMRTIIVHSFASSSSTLYLWKVSSGSSALNENRLLATTLNPSTTQVFDFGIPGLMFTSGSETLQANCTISSSLNVEVIGAAE